MYLHSFAQSDNATINVTELSERMNSDSTLIILDVRTPEELVGPLGKLKNVINIPVQNLAQRLDELEKYKEKEIAIICRSGNRSHQATMFLNQQGFKAKNVIGGMIEYRNRIKLED